MIPASAKTSDKVRNIIESHILERSKYRHKYAPLKEYDFDDLQSIENLKSIGPSPTFGSSDFTNIGKTPTDGAGAPTVKSIENQSNSNITINTEVVTKRSQLKKVGMRPTNGERASQYAKYEERRSPATHYEGDQSEHVL